MERRLLAFDLDRTLLTEEHHLPRDIELAIREAREQGHLVTVLTGRPKAATVPYLEQLGIVGPFGVNHGAAVYGERGELLRQSRLVGAEVASMLEPYLQATDLDFSCIVGDVLYVRDPEDERWSWAHTSNRVLRRFDPASRLDADKVVFAPDERTADIERELGERFPHFVTYLWGDGFLEVTAPDSDKGAALRLIAELLGVPQSATVAFGDGLNDVTMVGWAGHGVAVGPHAHPEVLSRARERIPPPEEGGVALWLERNLLRPRASRQRAG